MPLLNETPININGEIFGWSQVRVQLSTATIPFNLITAVSYSDSREKEKIYGSGDKSIGTGYGNYSAEGSITLLKDAMKALQNAAPQGDITLLDPFDVIISYRSSAVDKITVDVLKSCEFMSNPTSVKQNDKSIEVELPLLVSQIKRDKNFVF